MEEKEGVLQVSILVDGRALQTSLNKNPARREAERDVGFSNEKPLFQKRNPMGCSGRLTAC
jgi:hypothetical protein